MQPPPRGCPGWWLGSGSAGRPCRWGSVAGWPPTGARARPQGGSVLAPSPPASWGACSGPPLRALTWDFSRDRPWGRLWGRLLGGGDRALAPVGKARRVLGARPQPEALVAEAWAAVPAPCCAGVCVSAWQQRGMGIEGNTAPMPRPRPPPATAVGSERCPQGPCWEGPGASGTQSWAESGALQKGEHPPQGPGEGAGSWMPSAGAASSMMTGGAASSQRSRGGKEAGREGAGPELPAGGQSQVAAF